jgi:hypothetical protein
MGLRVKPAMTWDALTTLTVILMKVRILAMTRDARVALTVILTKVRIPYNDNVSY